MTELKRERVNLSAFAAAVITFLTIASYLWVIANQSVRDGVRVAAGAARAEPS